MRIKAFLVTMLLFFSLPAIALADQILINGGFESATDSRPDNWGYTEQAWSVPAGQWIGIGQTIAPYSGDRMALLAPGGLGTQGVWQEVDFTGYSQATLSFWWRYEAIDYDVPDNGRDALIVYVSDFHNGQFFWDRIWESDINVDPSDGPVVSPWMFETLSGDVTDSGKMTFLFLLRNDGDAGETVWSDSEGNYYGQQTVAFIDNASINATTVPEPASLLLLGTGLGVIGLAAWRRRK